MKTHNVFESFCNICGNQLAEINMREGTTLWADEINLRFECSCGGHAVLVVGPGVVEVEKPYNVKIGPVCPPVHKLTGKR